MITTKETEKSRPKYEQPANQSRKERSEKMSGVRKRHCVCFHGCAWAVSPQATTTTGSPTVGRKFSSPKEVILSWLDGGHRDHRILYSCSISTSKVVIDSCSPFSISENAECFRSHRASFCMLIVRLTMITVLLG